MNKKAGKPLVTKKPRNPTESSRKYALKKPKASLDEITLMILSHINASKGAIIPQISALLAEILPKEMNVRITHKFIDSMNNFLTAIVNSTQKGEPLCVVNDIDHNLSNPIRPDCHTLTAIWNDKKEILNSINKSGCSAQTWMERADNEIAKPLFESGKYILKCPKLKTGARLYLFNPYTKHYALSAGWKEAFITNLIFSDLGDDLFANNFGQDFEIYSGSKNRIANERIQTTQGGIIFTGDSPKDLDIKLGNKASLAFATCVIKNGDIICKTEENADIIFEDLNDLYAMTRVQRILFEIRNISK